MVATATKYRAVYRRLETDAEFRARVIDKLVPYLRHVVWVSGEELDKVAWNYAQLERRIVEDVS